MVVQYVPFMNSLPRGGGRSVHLFRPFQLFACSYVFGIRVGVFLLPWFSCARVRVSRALVSRMAYSRDAKYFGG